MGQHCTNVTIMCRNDELSQGQATAVAYPWLSSTISWVGCLLKDSELFIK